MHKRILVVDDQPIIAVALCEHLTDIASELFAEPITVTPLFTLADAETVLRSEDPPDLVFLDLALDDENNGLTTLRRFQDSNPNRVPVVIFTGLSLNGNGVGDIIRHAVNHLDARGVIMKSANLESMFVGLGRLLEGDPWYPREILKILAAPLPAPANNADGDPRLTARESDVAILIARGKRNKEIARELGKSPEYIRQVASNIYRKLGVNGRVGVILALKDP
jgi:DNA-binding NarL/FixJ family response regulator